MSWAHLGSEQLRAASGQPSLSASRPQREPGPAQPGRHLHSAQGRLSEELHELLLALTTTALESQVNLGQGFVVVVEVVVVVVVEVVVDVVVVVVVEVVVVVVVEVVVDVVVVVVVVVVEVVVDVVVVVVVVHVNIAGQVSCSG